MGEGEGEGGQDEDLLDSPSPLSPPAGGRGDFVVICLLNCGLLSKFSTNSFCDPEEESQGSPQRAEITEDKNLPQKRISG